LIPIKNDTKPILNYKQRVQLILIGMETPECNGASEGLEAKEAMARNTKLEDDMATFTARVRPKVDIQNYFVRYASP
jgi:hypothetical protein